MLEFTAYFLFVCALTSVIQALAGEARRSRAAEAFHFFLLVAGGIVGFSGIVYALEWLFIHRP